MTTQLSSTTISCPLPANLTPLSPNGFNLTITKLPTLSFFCQQVNLPGLSLGVPEQATPFSVQPIPGEMLTYDTLQVQFLVDSEMANYKAIHNWLIGLGFPESYDQYKQFVASDTHNGYELAKNLSDGTLQILTGTNAIAQSIKFVDMFPVSIGSLTFQSTNTDVQYLVGDVTFRYGWYKFV